MLYSFLFLVLSGIHFTFTPPMRLNDELLMWFAERVLDAILSETNKC